MRTILYWVLATSLATLAWSATPKKKATGKKPPVKTSASKAPTKSATARAGKKPALRTTWRNRQLIPTPERFREIQEALTARGYLRADNLSGKWDQDSVEALKKFQTHQNLESSGKINSLSLIALGLGPKYDSANVIDVNSGQR